VAPSHPFLKREFRFVERELETLRYSGVKV
jgi:hypothetical protein